MNFLIHTLHETVLSQAGALNVQLLNSKSIVILCPKQGTTPTWIPLKWSQIATWVLSQYKDGLSRHGDFHCVKIRWLWDHLIFIMGILYFIMRRAWGASNIYQQDQAWIHPQSSESSKVLRFPLKTKSCHNANFVITGGTIGCHNNNLQCPQWQQSWHYENSQFSVSTYLTFFLLTGPNKNIAGPKPSSQC